MKQLIFTAGLFFIVFSIFALTNLVYAQSQDQLAQKHGITFPIQELGNCNNIATCKVYCNQEENRDSCIAFAKSKGFYKETVNESQVTALSIAKAELGCDSVNSCKTLCQQKTNQARCQSFAQKHGLATSQTLSSKDEEILVKAKQNLGCDSFESCRALCDQEANYVKCAALLQDQITSDDRATFDKYRDKFKEFLGCDSMVTCMAFCMNPINTPKCTEFGNKVGFTGSDVPAQKPPEVWCPEVSSECRWDGTNCVCNGPESCQKNPDCRWDGLNCNCGNTPTTTTEPPEVWCPKAGPGCSWDGKQCACPGTGSPTQTDLKQPTQEPGEVWCPKAAQAGQVCSWDGTSCVCWDPKSCTSPCTWTGSKCDCPAATAEEPPEVWCPKNPGCTWTGTVCQCTPVQAPQTGTQTPQPAVQGTTTNRGLLQLIFDALFKK